MSLADIVKRITQRGVWTEDGKSSIDLEPPLDWSVLEQGQPNGLPWPRDVAEFLRFTSGFRIDYQDVRFGKAQEMSRTAFPCGLSIVEDGCGNDWIVDVDPTTGAWGAVYFDCHDPPVIVLQAPTIEQFLLDLETEYGPDAANPDARLSRPMADLLNNYSMDVWRVNKPLPSWNAFASKNPGIKVKLTPDEAARSTVADLRGAKLGDGFVWEGAGSTRYCAGIRRAEGGEPVFVVVREPE